jgi:uncharacterized DUF497 family protein
VRFAWDPRKADANLRAHGVRFAEAVTRFVTLGLSDEANLLVVVYAYREPDMIRVISAWKADKRERERYEEGRR